MALPELTRTLDDDFVNTWYDIRPDVTNVVIESNVLSLALKEFGCMKTQVGGEYITRTVGYGQKSTQKFDKGTVLEQSETPLDTMARWDWRYFLVDINRSLVDDSKNAGTFKIKDYIARRIEAAKDALAADMETDLFRWGAYTTAPYNFNGIYDIVPSATAESAVGTGSASGTNDSGTSNGNISRTNGWWKNWAADASSSEVIASRDGAATVQPYALNLIPDMDHFFNLIHANQQAPNFIIMQQAIYEAYGDEARDKQQIVRTGFNRKAADLGFETLTYKGAPLSYSSKVTEKHIMMLNMNHLEFVYNPNVWFDMTNWKETANQLERVAYIVCMTSGLITDHPRRHGIMEYTS